MANLPTGRFIRVATILGGAGTVGILVLAAVPSRPLLGVLGGIVGAFVFVALTRWEKRRRA